MLYTRKEKSQSLSAADLNYFKGEIIDVRNYVKKFTNLKFFRELYEKIMSISGNIDDPVDPEILAVDGTRSHLSIKLEDYGHKPNLNEESITSLILGIYNVTKCYPVILKLTNIKDERSVFREYLNESNMDIHGNNIFIMDRGFFSEEMVHLMNVHKLNYIMRLKSNSSLIHKKKII